MSYQQVLDTCERLFGVTPQVGGISLSWVGGWCGGGPLLLGVELCQARSASGGPAAALGGGTAGVMGGQLPVTLPTCDK